MASGDTIFASDFPVLAQVTGASVGTVGAGFSVNSALARTWGPHVYLRFDLDCTAGITASGANIADTLAFTVAAAYRPSEITSAVFSANPGTGEAQIGPDGSLLLRTSDANIAVGGDIRMSFSFLKAA